MEQPAPDETSEREPISLDRVRSRFLDAEAKLIEAAESIESVRAAATEMREAREGLASAAGDVREMAEALERARASVEAAVGALQGGVEALRLSDPAEVRRQLVELSGGLTGLETGISDRFSAMEERDGAFSSGVSQLSGETRTAVEGVQQKVAELQASTSRALNGAQERMEAIAAFAADTRRVTRRDVWVTAVLAALPSLVVIVLLLTRSA